MIQLTVVVLAAAIAIASPATSPTDSLFKAIRAGDPAAVQASIAAGASPNATDKDGMPALMYAAVVADSATMQALLDNGADPNSANPEGATALILSAADSAKAKLLIARGANVQVQSAAGATPLFVASAADGNAETVRLLLAKGAKVDVQDRLKSMPGLISGGGATPPLVAAARLRNPETLRTLLAAGASVNAKDANGATALSDAVLYDNPEDVRILLAAGGKVNFTIAAGGHTPLMAAAMRGNAKIVRMLLDAGAEVTVSDASGNTPLMWGAYTEYGDASVVNSMLAAGAAVNHVNKMGETALTWAIRRGETPVVAALRKAGARDNAPAPASVNLRPTAAADLPSIRAAVEKSLLPLQALGGPSFKKTGCISCHNHLMPMVAAATARDHGFRYDSDLQSKNAKLVEAFIGPATEPMREGLDLIPDIPITGGYAAMALHAAGVKPNATTDALVHRIALAQNEDGHWAVWAPRPPIEYSDITATALALRALALYGPKGRRAEFDQRIERARRWLEIAQPRTGEERNMRLMGLTWARAKTETIDASIAAVASTQRPDGGWAPLDTLTSDAYATGQSLFALREAGFSVTAPAYRRGVTWLRQTQQPDGSWHVKTRAYPLQVIVDTGYAYGPDQWISAQASSWAAMALMFAVEEPASLAQSSASAR